MKYNLRDVKRKFGEVSWEKGIIRSLGGFRKFLWVRLYLNCFWRRFEGERVL